MNMGIVQEVMDVLQQGYGNSSATPLDRTVATRVIDHLVRKGWLSPTEIGHIVLAAGGKVVIPREQLEDKDPLVKSYTDFLTDSVVFEVKGATIVDDRPPVEYRNVESGPIDVRPIGSK